MCYQAEAYMKNISFHFQPLPNHRPKIHYDLSRHLQNCEEIADYLLGESGKPSLEVTSWTRFWSSHRNVLNRKVSNINGLRILKPCSIFCKAYEIRRPLLRRARAKFPLTDSFIEKTSMRITGIRLATNRFFPGQLPFLLLVRIMLNVFHGGF
jgi:hypothetical protein